MNRFLPFAAIVLGLSSVAPGISVADGSETRCAKPTGAKNVESNARYVIYSRALEGERGIVSFTACNRTTGTRTRLTNGAFPTYGAHITNSQFRLTGTRIAYLVSTSADRETVRLTIRSFNLRTKRQAPPIEVGRAVSPLQLPDLAVASDGAIAWREFGRRADDTSPGLDRVGVRDGTGQKFVQVAPKGTIDGLEIQGSRLSWSVDGQRRAYQLQ